MAEGLERFTAAQENDYDTALAEIRSGRKRSHWMWYIFPQLAGLGMSANAQYYGIRDIREAREYLDHPILGKRLEEISTALLSLATNDPHRVFGSPDDMKLRSCMTLFASVPGASGTFQQVLDKFYGGHMDPKTIERLR